MQHTNNFIRNTLIKNITVDEQQLHHLYFMKFL